MKPDLYVGRASDGAVVTLVVHDDSTGICQGICVDLTPEEARKLAKQLRKAAKAAGE